MKTAESQELANTVVTFCKDVSKEVFKHTVNDFKKQNAPVRTIYNIVAKYRKRNSTSYVLKGARRRQTADQQLRTLVNLVDNKTDMSERRLSVTQPAINRRLK